MYKHRNNGIYCNHIYNNGIIIMYMCCKNMLRKYV